MDLFVYGTLADPRLIRKLTGREFPMAPAILRGYVKVFEAATGYFVVRPSEGGAVRGRLISGLDAEAIGRLDRYEGRLYRRITVEVTDERTGAGRPAELYVPGEPRPGRDG
jgi:gamma-glutamylcyclotransferase (GGCT)/AIG2-like uncharacterized protein YtfP